MAKEFSIPIKTQEWEEAQVDFLLAYGLAMSKWAKVENGLYRWFRGITRMKEPMARAIFYGTRGFAARSDLLEAAINYAEIQTPQEIEFITKALKKADRYSIFRNRIAHGEPIPHIHDHADGIAVKVNLAQAKNLGGEKLAISDLHAASENFHELGRLIISAIPRYRKDRSIEELLVQMLALPNEANSKTDANSAKHESQPQGGRVNKKAFRAARKAATRPPDEET